MRYLKIVALASILAVFLLVDSARVLENVGEGQTVLVEGFPDKYARHFHDITVKEGETTSGYKAGYRHQILGEMTAARKSAGVTLPWKERGPGNVGGRTRSIVVDANDTSGNSWFAGSVGGGIWKTEDAGLHWEPLTDDMPRLSIGTIAQAESNPDVLYAGTGEGYSNIDALIGDGIMKSMDGGDTWTVLASTFGGTDFLFVNRIIISPASEDVVLAATQQGIVRSVDGGDSWVRVLDADSFSGFRQILAEPGDFNIQYATEDGSGIWKSVDAGATWALSNQGLSEAGSNNRIELGISPASPSRLFALVEASGENEQDPVYISSNRADLWIPYEQLAGTSAIDIATSQGWYDQVVMPHPFDPDVVFMGGVRMYRLSMEGEKTVRYLSGIDQENTSQFLSFINFGATHLGGGLRIGTQEEESTIRPSQMVSVEVRFGGGISQMAHRFVPPDQSGVELSDYPYKDYVEVPFEVWDITNNRQLHVSFRDRSDDGEFNLIERDENNLGREYVFVSARPYTEEAPDPDIAKDGGVVTEMAYFFWPILTPDGTWDSADLPESILRMNFQNVIAPTRETSVIASGIHVDQHSMAYFATGTEGDEFRLIAGNDGGVFYSGDGGSSWNSRFRGYNTAQFYGVDKKPGKNEYVGGTQDNGSWKSFGSPSAASAWQKILGGDGFDAIWHKQNDNRLLSTSQNTNIWRSSDGGASFQSAALGMADTGSACDCAQFITSLSSNRFNSDEVYTLGKTGVWVSRNFAGSWTSRPIPAADWGYSGNGRVHVSNASGSVVWAGYEMDLTAGGGDNAGKVQVSTDRGETFSSTVNPSFAPGRLSGISSSFEDSATVYVTFSFFNDPKILRSRDMGQTWEDLTGFEHGASETVSENGFPDVATFDVIDFPDSPVIWAGTEIGLIESLDDGATWHVAQNGLPAVAIWQMRLVDEQVVLATHGRGVWTLPQSAVSVDTEDEFALLPERFELQSIYPNPFTESATINWSADRPGSAHIQIFDIQGRRVANVFDGFVAAGIHEHTWRPTGLAAGVYFAQIVTASGVETRSFIRAK